LLLLFLLFPILIFIVIFLWVLFRLLRIREPRRAIPANVGRTCDDDYIAFPFAANVY
jgi:hypothetical protein